MPNTMRDLIKTMESPYCFYAYILDCDGLMDYFHYGVWESDTTDMKTAQENLALLMKSRIPDGIKRILDVGCGLGKTTYDLTKAGYETTGISPDSRIMEFARLKYQAGNLNLITVSFENFNNDYPFDLILFQESTQYINLTTLFSHCSELLQDNGYILMCDEFVYGKTHIYASQHKKQELLKIAAKHGFKQLHNEDITKKVLRTRTFGLDEFTEHREGIIQFFSSFKENTSEELDGLIDGWKKHSELFESGMAGYEIFLFKKTATSNDRNHGSIFKHIKELLPNVVYGIRRRSDFQ